MRDRARNRTNALKHGVFAKMLILPWEDVNKFVKLHADLVEEWKPVGPTERDAVLSIAKGVWRKRRLQCFLESKSRRHNFIPEHRAYDEAAALRVFSTVIGEAPDAFDRALNNALTPENADHLRRKFPRSILQPTSEWICAVQNEIKSVLLPAAECFS